LRRTSRGRVWADLGGFGRIWESIHLAKSKLEVAVERHVDALNDAQRELVLSQFSLYKSNKARLAELKSRIDKVDSRPAASLDDVRAKQAQRSTLSYEYNQLATANSRIASDLFIFLEEGR